MDVHKWLNKIAYKKTVEEDNPDNYSFEDDIKAYDVWLSKFDDSYITHVGMEDHVQFLADLEITEELTRGVGFSPKENKWFGWSHRAIYGFAPGSTCKKGDCHYTGSNIKELEEDAINFWKNEYHINVRCEGIVTNKEGDKFFDIKWEYTDDVENKDLRGITSGTQHFITKIGKGEWVAKTWKDAKKMAIDFNKSVS